MENRQLAIYLKEMARIMGLLGENAFKIRAFENGARIVDQLEEPAVEIAERGALEKLPGIGKGLAEVIREFTQTGSSIAYTELKQQVPPGVLEILSLPGLGAKKVQTLWTDLDITTVGELEYACTENRLLKLKGFGPRMQTKVLEAIQFRKKHSNMLLIDAATKIVEDWLQRLSELPSVSLCSAVGEVRRGLETIRSLEVLVAVTSESEFVQQLSAILTENEGLRDTTPFIVSSEASLDIVIHSCADNEFSARLIHHTGSETHIEALKQLANKHDLSYAKGALNSASQIELGGSEADFYSALSLPFHPPEVREGSELHAEVPELVSADMIQGFFHAHTTWSDGMHSLREMVVAAYEAGYHYMGISEHSPAAFYAGGLSVEQVFAQWEEIDTLNAEWNDFTIFRGIESDILPDGSLDYPAEILAQFDFIVASIHNQFNLDIVKQTDRIIRALQSPYSTMLGHPTGRLLLSRDAYEIDMAAVIEAAAETNTLIEINCTAQRMDLDWRWLNKTRELGVMVSINPDAHHINMIDTIPLGVKLARKGMLTPDDVLNTRSSTEIREWLDQRKTGLSGQD